MRLLDIFAESLLTEDVIDLSNTRLKTSKYQSFDGDIESYTFTFPVQHGGEIEAYVRAAGDTLEFADLLYLNANREHPTTFKTTSSNHLYRHGVRLGTAETRKVLNYIVKTVRADHPEVKKLSSTRVTGARQTSGKMGMDMMLPEGVSTGEWRPPPKTNSAPTRPASVSTTTMAQKRGSIRKMDRGATWPSSP